MGLCPKPLPLCVLPPSCAEKTETLIPPAEGWDFFTTFFKTAS